MAEEFVVRIGGTAAPLRAEITDLHSFLAKEGARLANEYEKAFQTLGLRSSQAIQREMTQVTDSYFKILSSAKAVGHDVARVQTAWEGQMKRLTNEYHGLTEASGKADRGVQGVGDSSRRATPVVRELGDVSQVTNAVLGTMGTTGNVLGRIIDGLKSPFATVAAGIGVAAFVGSTLVGTLTEITSKYERLSSVAGASVPEVSKVAEAFQLAGKDGDMLNRVLFRLSSEIDSGGQTLDQYGISLRKASGEVKEPLELFLEMRNRLSKTGDAVTLNTTLMRFWGRAGLELVPIFKMGEAEFERYMDRATGLSLEHVRQAKEYRKQVNEIGVAWENLKIELAAPIMAQVQVGLKFAIPGGQFAGSLIDTVYNALGLGLLSQASGAVARGIETAVSGILAQLERLAGYKPPADEPMTVDAVFKRYIPGFAHLSQYVDAAVNYMTGRLGSLAGYTANGPPSLPRPPGMPTGEETAAALAALKGADLQRTIEEVEQRERALRSRIREAMGEIGLLSSSSLEIRINVAQARLQTAQQTINRETQLIHAAVAAATLSEEDGLRKRLTLAERELAAVIAFEDAKLADIRKKKELTTSELQQAEQARVSAVAAAGDKVLALRGQLSAGIRAVMEAELAIQATVLQTQTAQREHALQQEMALVLGEAKRRAVLLEATERETSQAEYFAAVDLAGKKLALDIATGDQELRLLQTRLAKNLIGWEEYDKAEAQIRARGAASRLAGEKATEAALEAVRDAAAKSVLRGMELALGAETRLNLARRQAEEDLDNAILAGKVTTAQQIALARRKIDDADLLSRAASVQQEIDLEARANALRVTNYLDAEKQKLVKGAANIREREVAEQRLVDAEIAMNVQRLLGDRTYAEKRLAIEAGTVEAILAHHERILRGLETLASAGAQRWDQLVRSARAAAQLSGDAWQVFGVELTDAFTRGTDLLSSLPRLAQDVAQSTQRAFSDFFFDVFEGRLTDLKKLVADFKGSVSRALADFVSNTITNQIGQMLGSLFNVGTSGGAALSQASTTAAASVMSLSDAAQACAVAMNNAASANGGTPAALATVPGAGGAPGGGFLGTFVNIGKSFIGAWSNISTNFMAGWDSGFGGLTGGLSAVWNGTAAPSWATGAGSGGAMVLPAGGTGGVGGLSGIGSGAMSGLQIGMAWAGAALGTIMVALDENKTDIGKAIQSATLVAGAALAPATAGISLVVAAVVNWLEDMFGVFESASEAWLKFPELLSATLQGTQAAIQGFQQALPDVKNLRGLGQVIADFRQKVQDAGVGGFVAATQGEGAFVVPGVPGATGTDHEGKLSVNFQPWIDELNAAVQTIIRSVRTQLAETLPDQIRHLLPEELFEQFERGALASMQARFEQLIRSGESMDTLGPKLDAFEADLQTFSQAALLLSQVSDQIGQLSSDFDRLTASAVAGMKIALAGAAQAVRDAQRVLAAAATGPEFIAAAQEYQAAILAEYELKKRLVNEVETRIAGLLEGPGGLWAELQTAISVHALEQGDVSHAVAFLGTLQSIAGSSDSAALRLWAVHTALAAITTLGPSAVRGGAIGGPEEVLPGLVAAAKPFLDDIIALYHEARDHGDLDAALALLKEGAGAATSLANAALAGIDEWQQEAVAAVEEWAEAAISSAQRAMDVLNTYAARFAALAVDVVVLQVGAGNASGLKAMHAALMGVASTAESVAVRLWAITTAGQALAAAIPAGVASGMFGSPEAIGGAAAAGLREPLTQIDRMYRDARAAGDWELALKLLAEAADLTKAVGQAAKDGVEAWARREEQRIRDVGRAQAEANDLLLEGIDEQRTSLEKNLEKSRELARAADGLGSFIRQLRLGPQAPPDPQGQFDLAESFYNDALTAFRAKPTAETVGNVQRSAQDLLAAAQLIYTRPSAEYAELFDRIVDELEVVQRTAMDLVTPEEEAVKQLNSLNDQAKQLQEANREIARNTEMQVKAVYESAEREIEQINGAITSVLQTIAIEQAGILSQFAPAIDAASRTTVEALEDLKNTKLKDIADRAKEQADLVRAQLALALGAIAGEQGSMLRDAVAAQIQLLENLTDGDTVQVFMAKQAKIAADKLTDLYNLLWSYLSTGTLPSPDTTTAEEGMTFRRMKDGGRALTDGFVYVDAPEDMVPATVGPLPEERSGGTTVYVTNHIHIEGYGKDKEELVDEMLTQMDRRDAYGRGAVIARRRQPSGTGAGWR